MASPFPGMDPYLEDSEIWVGFHHSLADELKAMLNQFIGPKYYADVETRTVAEEVGILTRHIVRPDVGVFPGPTGRAGAGKQSVREVATVYAPVSTAQVAEPPVRRVVLLPDRLKLHSVHIYTTGSAQLVTAIEILSPYNKRPSEGLEEYRKKRAQLLKSSVHLMELDLLRGGERPGREVLEPPLEADYMLLVNRATDEGDQRISDIWTSDISRPLPVLPVPLLAPDADVALDLGAAVGAVYARAGYDWRIDYSRPVPPPELRPEMAAWLRQRLSPAEGEPAPQVA